MIAVNYATRWYNRVLLNPCDGGTSRGTINVYEGDADMSSIPQKICGIYKITNLVNGKCYIGQSRDIAARWKDHRRKSPHLSNIYLHRAIRKHGIENFLFEVLEECDISQLNNLEREYISAFNSLKPNGYNLDSGGEAGKETSQETKEKLRQAVLGAKNPNYGKHKSEATREKLAISHSPSVNQYSMDGKYIRTFATTIDASKSVGENNQATRSNICACCRGDRMATSGYQWRWAECGIDDIQPYRKSSVNRVSVDQLTLDGEFIVTYRSAQEAGEAVGRTNANILFACRSGGTSGGYRWRFTEC